MKICVNKVKSETIRMLPDRQNTSLCLHTNTTDTTVLEKQITDEATIAAKSTKSKDS